MTTPNSTPDIETTTGARVENNPSNNAPPEGDNGANRRRRTPFTDLSQVDADLALARTLQEQERAYMMLRMTSGLSSDYGSWEAESYGNEDVFDDDYGDVSGEDYDGSDVEVDDEAEDAFDVHAHEAGDEGDNENADLDPSSLFSSDETYAGALQDAEEREMAARLLALAGISNMVVAVDEEEEEEEHGGNLQDTWEELDPDELSYEELIALGDVVGTENRGLSANSIASLPSVKYHSQGIRDGSSDACVICRLDYEDGDTLTSLSCKHSYHTDCINKWLQINKVCPVCSAEVRAPVQRETSTS